MDKEQFDIEEIFDLINEIENDPVYIAELEAAIALHEATYGA